MAFEKEQYLKVTKPTSGKQSKAKKGKSDLTRRYVNREYSWLLFNSRVLEEAARSDVPLLERIKFLAIFESNLDEFYMVRVSGLIEQHESGVSELSPDGLTAIEQLKLIERFAKPLRARASEIWELHLKPALAAEGIEFLKWGDLTEGEQLELGSHFMSEVFPVLTPIILSPNPAVPFISNRSLNLAVELFDDEAGAKLGRVKVPNGLQRAIQVSKDRFILLEELLRNQLHTLFPGVRVLGSHLFRVVRDADIEIRELEASDLIATIEETLKMRRFGDPVLLEIESSVPTEVLRQLQDLLQLEDSDTFSVSGLLGMDALWQLASLSRPALKFPHHTPALTENLASSAQLFEAIARQDVLTHQPFDSFKTVDDFVAAASQDPDVIGIKMTLYRVGTPSPIVQSLLDAAENGKQVAVMVELKARFDESNNLVWARTLERAGVHVSYGFAEQKVHCKVCLVVRREGKSVRTYAHVGTGNYNPATARIYTDLGLFTSDPAITRDVSNLFNSLTGFSKHTDYQKLLVSPYNVRDGIIERIEREIVVHQKFGNGRIIFKLNSLVDPEVIEALYAASNAGVRIDLIVRGISCVRPGAPELSENIRVTSVVGRFLEHSRAYYFANNGQPELLIGSADMMRRNLDRRTEVLVPIQAPSLIHLVKNELLETYLRDNTNAWIEHADGTYTRVQPKPGTERFSSQNYLIAHPLTRLQFDRVAASKPNVSENGRRKSSK